MSQGKNHDGNPLDKIVKLSHYRLLTPNEDRIVQKTCIALVRPCFQSLLKLWVATLLLLSFSAHGFSFSESSNNLSEEVERILKKSNQHGYFEKNVGQWNSSFLGLAQGSNMNVRFYEDKISFILTSDDQQDVFVYNMRMLNMNKDAHLTFKNKKIGHKNYLNCVDTVPLFEEVRYKSVYPNIDLRFYINQNSELEFDYIILPGGNPADINYILDGVESIKVIEEGALTYCSPFGELKASKPYTYQGVLNETVEIASRYVIQNDSISFSIDEFDTAQALIIDPTVFEWSTYLGGSGLVISSPEEFYQEGEFLYVTGLESETQGIYDYPVTPGLYLPNTSSSNIINLVVSKFDTLGNLHYSTYLPFDSDGTKVSDFAFDDNSVFFTFGFADHVNFLPGISSTAFDATRSTNSAEAVVGRLDSAGLLQWSTYLGGSREDYSSGISVADGIVAVVGSTNSTDFPLHQANVANIGGDTDGFLSKFDYNGNILYSSYLGVSNPTFPVANHTVVTKNGYTGVSFFLRAGTTVPVTQSPVPPLSLANNSLVHYLYDANNNIHYSTQYNNEGIRISDIEFDGNQLCLLSTQSGNSGYTSSGAYITNNLTGGTNSHLYCVDVPSSSLSFATYNFNNATTEVNNQIQVENGNIYVGGIMEPQGNFENQVYLQKFDVQGNLVFQKDFGYTASTFVGLEVYNGEALLYVDANPADHVFSPTLDAVQINPINSAVKSSYLMRTDASGNYTYGTWISGSSDSQILTAFLYNGSIYAMGTTSLGFPTTVGAYQTLHGSLPASNTADINSNFYVLKINDADCIDDLSPENIIQPDYIEVCMNGTVPFLDGPDIGIIEDSLPHYLINNVLTQGNNNFFINYQWQISFVGSSDWIDIAGATNPAYQPQPLADDAEFRRIIYLEYADCFFADTSNLSLVEVNEFYAPNLPPDTVYYKCATSAINLDVTAAGGTPPYNYQWSPTVGLNNPNIATPITNVSESTIYNVEVTDQNGCLFIEQFTVRVYEADAGDEMISCIGTGVQIGTPHVAPGIPGFTYSWSPTLGLSNPTIAQPIANPPGPITYTVSINGPDNCTVTDDILVEPIQTVANAGADQTFCFGGSVQIGELNDSDYDFVWSPSQYLNNNLLSNPIVNPDELPQNNPITYYVTKVHKVTGCTDFDSTLVYINNAEAGHDFCGPRFIGSPDHSSGLASFQWTVLSGDVSSIVGQENNPTPYVSPNQPTLYRLAVTWNGVTCIDQVFVPECGCLIPDAGAISDFNCEVGDTNYNTVVFGSNIDTSRYNYLWSPSLGIPNPTSPFSQNFTISLTTATTYTLTASLKTNPSVSCSSSVVLFPAPPPFPFAHAKDTITCLGLGVNIGGPTIAGWTATWTPDNGTLDQTSVFNPVATPTELSTYVVTIEETSSECQIRDTAIVEIFDIVADAGQDATYCENSIVELGTPAIPGLVYSWEPSLGITNSNMAQPIDTIFATTIYYLTVSDSANTCSVVDTLVYTVVNNPTANAGENTLICQGGLGVQIGTPAIPGNTYAWSPTTGLSDPNIAQPFANPNSTTLYTLTVANNAEGCFSTDAITVTVSNGEAVDAGSNQIVCLNSTVQIGTSPPETGYSYSWSPATGLNNPNIAEPTATVTDTITYTVTVTSPTGCIVQDTVALMPSIPIVDAGEDITTCPNIDVIIGTAALPGYSYLWSPTTGLDNPNLAQPTLSTSANQVYTLTATDANDCDATDQIMVSVQSVSVDAGPDQSICSAGVTIGTPTQGSDFTYSWSPANSLNNANVAQPIATPNTETMYTVTITQLSTGCTASDVVTVTPATTTDAGPDRIVCQGESVLLGTPGLQGLSYSWSPATGLDNPNIAQPTATVSSSIQYILTVSNGACASSDEVQIDLHPNPDVTLSDFEAVCLGSYVQIGPMPVSSFRYSWSPALGLSDPTIANPIACPSMTTIYNLVVTDLISGCSTEENVTVNVANNPPPEPDAGLDKELCPDENTQIGVPNQDNKYSYVWSPTTYLTNPFAPISNVIIPSNVQGSLTYILTAIDPESGCEGQDTVLININDNPLVPLIPDVQACQNNTVFLCEDCTENPNYSYAWSPGNAVSDSTSLNISVIVEHTTTLELSVTNNQTGCTSSSAVIIEVNNQTSPNADAGADQVICLDEVISIGQSDDGDTYAWYPVNLRSYLSDAFISDPSFTPVDTGSFILWLEVENTEGCTSVDTIVIDVLNDVTIDAGTSFFTCESSVFLNASSNMRQGMWSLFSGPNSPIITMPHDSITQVTSLTPGTYKFAWTIMDTEVCNNGDFDLVTVEVLPKPNTNIGPDITLCLNEEQEIGGANQGLIYTWYPENLRPYLSDPFSSNPIFTATDFGEFTLWLEVENVAGCVSQDTMEISVLESVVVDAGNEVVTCDREISLSGSASIGGGMWISMGGPSTPLIHSPTSAMTQVTQIVPGTYTFGFSTTATNICNPDEVDTVEVIILETPDADAGPNVTICDDETTVLGPNTVNGSGSYEWFPVSQRANLSDTFVRNPTYTPSSTGFFELWVEMTNMDGCTHTDTMELEVLGYAITTVVDPIVTCQREANLQATISDGQGEWVFVNGPSMPAIENPSSPTTSVSNLVPGMYTLSWVVVSEDVCNEGEAKNITLEVLNAPQPEINIICSTINNETSFSYTVLVAADGAIGDYDIAGFDNHTGLAFDQVHGPFGPFIIANSDFELVFSFEGTECDNVVRNVVPNCQTTDFGDLPDSAAGTSAGNYETYSYNNGPSHKIVEGLRIAALLDTEKEALVSTDALGDGNDEDAYAFINGMELIKEAIYVLPLQILNTTGETSFLEIWVDWNGDGDFMDLDEFVLDEQDDSNGNFSSPTWNLTIPTHTVENQNIGMRIRLSLRDNMTPYGQVDSGEVEDYLFRAVVNDDLCLPLVIRIEN